MKHIAAALLTLVWILSGPLTSSAYAGVAVVQAVEQSSGICAGKNAAAAFDCAKKKCVKGGAAKADCIEMSYCRSGWTVDVFMQGTEGAHWHEYYCGWNDRASALKAGKLACDPKRMKELMECAPVQVINDQGKSFDIPAETAQ